MLLDAFSACKMTCQPISHTQERSRASMFEDMQAAVEHLRRKVHLGIHQGFQQLGNMLCCVGKIQNTSSIRPMPIGKELTPVCPVHDSPDLFCFPHSAPSDLHFCHTGKGRSIR